jgi:putative acetyltransferase
MTMRTIDELELRPLRRGEGVLVTSLLRDVRSAMGVEAEAGTILEAQDYEIERVYLDDARARYVVGVRKGVDVPEEVAAGVGIRPLVGEPRLAHIQRMYVREAYRRQGLARLLVQDVLAAAQRLGYEGAYVETMERLHEARALYHSLGFQTLNAPRGLSGHGFAGCWLELKWSQQGPTS